jgi:transcriptional regulator with XRE-family HTH domain
MVGKELRAVRLEAGMTQEELAFKAGVDRSYISLLENDRKSPTLDMLFRICQALDASVSDIIARVEKKRKSPR